MQKWEYILIIRSQKVGSSEWGYKTNQSEWLDFENVGEMLTSMGQKGWELITVFGHPSYPTFYLKRPVEEK